MARPGTPERGHPPPVWCGPGLLRFRSSPLLHRGPSICQGDEDSDTHTPDCWEGPRGAGRKGHRPHVHPNRGPGLLPAPLRAGTEGKRAPCPPVAAGREDRCPSIACQLHQSQASPASATGTCPSCLSHSRLSGPHPSLPPAAVAKAAQGNCSLGQRRVASPAWHPEALFMTQEAS